MYVTALGTQGTHTHAPEHTYTHWEEIHTFTGGNTHTVTHHTHTHIQHLLKLVKPLKWIGLFGHIVYFQCPWEAPN